MEFNALEHLKSLVGRLPLEEQMRARLAFAPTARLLVMEEVFAELGGKVMGRDALGQALEERSRRACEQPAATAPCPRCGKRSRLLRVRERRLESTLRPVTYRRPEYLCARCKTFAPLDEELGVKRGEKRSPRLAEAVERLAKEMPYEDAVKEVERWTGCCPSHSTARRAAMDTGQAALEVEEKLAEAAKPGGAGVEAEARTREVNATDTLVVTVDGTCVLTRPNEAVEVKAGLVYLERDRLVRKTRNGKTRATLLRARETAHIGHWEEFAWKVYALALRAGLARVGRVVVLSDGAQWIARMAKEFFPKAVHIVDFWHAVEYLAAAARETFGEKSHQGTAWVKRQQQVLRAGKHAQVVTALKRLRPRRGSGGEKKADAIRYLTNHREQMRYDEYEKQGLPIGSGSIESRCRHLVGTRLKRAGARWDPACAQRLLALRTAWNNGEWERFHPGVNPRYIKRPLAA